MADFYLDHNVSHDLARELQALGHVALTAYSQGTERREDDEHLAIAAVSGWTLITYNRRDFVLLHRAWSRWPWVWGTTPLDHHGILVIPDESRLPAPEAARAIQYLLSVPITNQLFRYRPGPPPRWERDPVPSPVVP